MFVAHHAGVVRHIAYLLGDRAAAEDIAQEVFLQYLRKPPREPGPLGPWLRLVATRLAYNYLRAERRRRAREDGMYRDPSLAPAQTADGPAERETDGAAMRGALGRLGPRDRMALLLRAAGHDYHEIALAISVRPSSVGTILARATRRLKAEYLAVTGSGASADPLEVSAEPTEGGWRPHDALR